jgi:hypothetical protein
MWGYMAVGAMPLLPRWRFMTDEAKALTKRVAVSAVAFVLASLLLRILLRSCSYLYSPPERSG